MVRASLPAFADELSKIAASSQRLNISKTRAGRRPMRVDTLLRKEKEGSMFKEGTMESHLPWYTTAAGAAGGAMLGEHLVPKKYRALGVLGGTLLGTGVGLHGGEAAGRALDQRSAKRKLGDAPTADDGEQQAEAGRPPIWQAQETRFPSKLASLTEMEKEALLGHLLRSKKKIIDLGGEVVDLNPTSRFSYKGLGNKLQELGGLYKEPSAGIEAARAAGRSSSAGGRIFGEALSEAGEHMGHASTVGKVLNPLGQPMGGAFKGLASGAGKELARGAAAGSARQAAGGALQRHAGKVGLAGEILGAAGTATAVGGAISPLTAAMAKGLSTAGAYAPLKAKLGLGGLNLVKDVAATGVEKALGSGAARGVATKALSRGARSLGSAALKAVA